MKKYLIFFLFLLAGSMLASAQSSDPLMAKCLGSAGANAKYLKDFRVQLGKTGNGDEMRFKANMSLWKNTKYRFSMCNSETSKGRLILSIRDETNKIILSSYDKNTGKVYPFVDFTCSKSGIYQLSYDFDNGQPGSGVGIVSMIR